MANKQQKKTTNSKGKGKKPAFNFYWIYAIIAVILISINLFNKYFPLGCKPINIVFEKS